MKASTKLTNLELTEVVTLYSVHWVQTVKSVPSWRCLEIAQIIAFFDLLGSFPPTILRVLCGYWQCL